jgi:hypothetical protein
VITWPCSQPFLVSLLTHISRPLTVVGKMDLKALEKRLAKPDEGGVDRG